MNITNLEKAKAAIDRYGRNLSKIKKLEDDNKGIKADFEKWANENPDKAFPGDKMEGQTESFYYAMALEDPSLKVQSHKTAADVVALMRADEAMAKYVVTTYDKKAVKKDFSGSAAKRESVKDFGLYFTNPQPHLVVKAL